MNNLNNNYNPVNKIKRKEKNDTLKSAKKMFHIREEIIRAFKSSRVVFFPTKKWNIIDNE